MSSKKNSARREKVLEELRELSPSEREELLKELQSKVEVPVLYWTPNPQAVKSTFNLLLKCGEVELEEIRKHLHEKELIKAEEGEYNIGIISRKGDSFFNVTGSWGPECKISLTETGREFANVLKDEENLSPLEKTILTGIQPYGTGFVYLSILEKNREDGILREDLQDKLVELYGNKGKYYTGYYTTWFSRIGLIKKEKEERKVRYLPNFPSAW